MKWRLKFFRIPCRKILFSLLLFYAFMEFSIFGLTEMQVFHLSKPSFSLKMALTMYYTHDHPVFGLWRNPNTVKRHFSKSFDVLYESNSYGARDMERDRKSDQPRVIVLGDSFTEGHGLHPEDRITNLLEDRSRIPHLNFGIADSGTTEQLLVYRHLARDFDHA